MQSLTNTLNAIAVHLRGLSPTAKMLIASLMVILVMTLFLVAQYAGRTSMEPLGLKAGLSGDARARAVTYLQSRNIPHRDRGNEILVPTEQRYSIIAALTDGEIITPDQINFDTLIQQDSPLLSRSQNERRWLVATMNVLARTISSMSGIERATVVIDEPKAPVGIGRAHVPASASVTVVARAPLSQNKVDAISEMVAGAHANLPVDRVRVIDAVAGTVHRARSADALAAAGGFQIRREEEQAIRDKIADFLAYIPGVTVAVQATLDTKEVIEQRQNFDEPRLGVTGESSRALSSTQQSGGGEAGVRPNTGASITTGSGRRVSSLSDERSSASMIPFVPSMTSKTREHRAQATQINAAIGVPRSYFVRLFRDLRDDPNAVPTPAELDAVAASEIERITAQVEPLIDTSAVEGAVSGTVVVSMIPDYGLPATLPPPPGVGAPGGRAISDFASDGFVKHIGLAALALLSLAMMFLMVRKATVSRPLPTADELMGLPPALAGGDADVVGEASESITSLEGVELDDNAVRRQEMLEQINEMAKGSPQEVVGLLRRWIKAPA